MSEPVGALYDGNGRCTFRVWAPDARTVGLVLYGADAREVPLTRGDEGMWAAHVDGVVPGDRYRFRLDGGSEHADPASFHQPDGVHGPSAVVDPGAYAWGDAGWTGRTLRELVLYELHVGTFTPEGTFEAAARETGALAELGVTAVEIMPVAQFPGTRNWGYDGAFPFAVQDSYGGPDGLKQLIDACHADGLSVALDVVYNHIGPEGSCLDAFGPYFTDRYRTPWGRAVNVDGPGSDAVRAFFIQNAVRWLEEFHIDILRLDAIHGIVDQSALPFLRELSDAVAAVSGRTWRRLLIAESDLNDPRVVLPPVAGGLGNDAQWCDDFHHALHVTLTGERDGYYADYDGAADLATAMRDGYVFQGRHSAVRGRRHGTPPDGLDTTAFVVCAQNHDQIGNRMLGDRLAASAGREQLKLAAAAVLLSPFVPLLFMGEEYAEIAPFPYFISHGDPELVEAVRRGRRREFADFEWAGEPPDPQSPETFASARLDRRLQDKEPHAAHRRFVRALIELRSAIPALTDPRRSTIDATAGERSIAVQRWDEQTEAVLLLNAGDGELTTRIRGGDGPWLLRIDSAAEAWGGPGSRIPETIDPGAAVTLAPHSAALLTRDAKEGA